MNTTPFVIHELNTALGAGGSQVSITYLCRQDQAVGIRSIPRHCDSLTLEEERLFETQLAGDAAALLWALVEKLGFEQHSGHPELGHQYVVLNGAQQWNVLTAAIATAKQEIHWLEALMLPVDVVSVVVSVAPWIDVHQEPDPEGPEPDGYDEFFVF